MLKKNSFLSHTWSLQGLLFLLRFSVDKITSLVSKNFYAANSNSFFSAGSFSFANSIRPLMQAVCILFVTAFGLPPAPYMGFGVIGAGRWQLRLFFRYCASVTGQTFLNLAFSC